MGPTYDLIVIGAGAAGSSAAKLAVRQGLDTALIEENRLGGTCLNYGCDPTKFLLHEAHSFKRSKSATQPDSDAAHQSWPKIIERAQELIERVRGGSHAEAVHRQEKRGIDVVLGQAQFEDGYTLRAGNQTLAASHILIATGYRTAIPNIPGLAGAGCITNREAVALKSFPQRLAILGAGPVGIEFAQIFSRFGARVTVFEQGPRILLKDDGEAARLLQQLLGEEGIRFECNATIERVEANRIHWCRNGSRDSIDVDRILVATGRAPDLAPLHLDAAGVETRDGRLVVRDTLQTSVPHIWAAGDITDQAPFTHVASAQAKHVIRNLNTDTPANFDARAIPWATYTFPALAHVGQTEEQLQERGISYRVLKVDFREITRNVLTDQEKGIYKVLVDEEGVVLGAHILANHADELVAPIILAMRHGLNIRQIAETILPYPTMSEALTWTAAKFEGPKSLPSDVECSVRPCKDDDRENPNQA